MINSVINETYHLLLNNRSSKYSNSNRKHYIIIEKKYFGHNLVNIICRVTRIGRTFITFRYRCSKKNMCRSSTCHIRPQGVPDL